MVSCLHVKLLIISHHHPMDSRWALVGFVLKIGWTVLIMLHVLLMNMARGELFRCVWIACFVKAFGLYKRQQQNLSLCKVEIMWLILFILIIKGFELYVIFQEFVRGHQLLQHFNVYTLFHEYRKTAPLISTHRPKQPVKINADITRQKVKQTSNDVNNLA